MKQTVAGIANIQTPDRGLGYQGELLYFFQKDLSSFKNLTKNQVVIMGRKTFDSLPEKNRPLPNRINIVVTSSPGLIPLGETVFAASTPEEALLIAQETFPDKEIWIIGGEQVFSALIHRIDILYLTTVPGNKPADCFFPEYSEIFTLTSKEDYTDPVSQKDFSIEVLKRTTL